MMHQASGIQGFTPPKHRRGRSRLQLAYGLVQPTQRLIACLLTAARVLLGCCDLLLAAMMYLLFVLLQGGTAKVSTRWVPHSVLSAAIVAAVVVTVRTLLEIGSTYWIVEYTQNLYRSFLLRLTDGYGSMRWSEFVQRNRSEMLKHATSTALDAAYSYQLLVEGISGAVVVCILSAALVYQSPGFAVGLLGALLLLFALHRFFMQQRLKQAGADREHSLRLLQRTVSESLAYGKEIRTYRAGSYFRQRISDLATSLGSSNARLALLPQLSRVFAEQGTVLAFLLVLMAVSLHHQSFPHLLSLLVFYFVLSRRLIPLISQIALVFGQMEGAYENLATISSEFAACTHHASQIVASALPQPGCALELENLSLCYETGRFVLRDLTLQVSLGEIVALRGVSGSGKSSFINIIAGVLEPTSGSLRILDREHVAYVPQDVILLDDTIRTNLLFGAHARTDVELMSSLEVVNLRTLVESLPEGLGTRVGDNGVLLSGGQRQRLGLARALLRQVSLLLLDEATSALDEENEASILRHLAGQNLAILMVTHRTSSIHFADRVYRLEDGTLISDPARVPASQHDPQMRS